MPSDHRLHPASILFSFVGQLKNFALPGLLVLFGAGRSGADWQPWMMLLIIPTTIAALLRYVSFSYRYEPTEMVVRSGLIFRNERHIPYARIQNLDAVQNVAHRALKVIEVRVQTGSGSEPEATMSVLPVAAFEEMRRRVFAGRESQAPAADPAASLDGSPSLPVAVAQPQGVTLLALDTRELMICGFIENRGLIVVGALFGLIFELGVFDNIVERTFGEDVDGRGVIRDLFRSFIGADVLRLDRMLVASGAIAGILVLVRLLSMGWAVVRLHGFRLTRIGEDLRTEFGLFTRVVTTIPIRRIQTVSIRQGLLHRWFDRVAVKVETAGGEQGQVAAADRKWLAPIVRASDVPDLVRAIVPELDLANVEWHPVHPGAFRRVVKGSLVFWTIVGLMPMLYLRWWTLALLAITTAWAIVSARQHVRHLGWSLPGANIGVRQGWMSKSVTVARFVKIQAVELSETPFDRRWRMARVGVDTAGGGAFEGGVEIRYLAREKADELYGRLSLEAARTEFTW